MKIATCNGWVAGYENAFGDSLVVIKLYPKSIWMYFFLCMWTCVYAVWWCVSDGELDSLIAWVFVVPIKYLLDVFVCFDIIGCLNIHKSSVEQLWSHFDSYDVPPHFAPTHIYVFKRPTHWLYINCRCLNRHMASIAADLYAVATEGDEMCANGGCVCIPNVHVYFSSVSWFSCHNK